MTSQGTYRIESGEMSYLLIAALKFGSQLRNNLFGQHGRDGGYRKGCDVKVMVGDMRATLARITTARASNRGRRPA
jgi:hypothetical protein